MRVPIQCRNIIKITKLNSRVLQLLQSPVIRTTYYNNIYIMNVSLRIENMR